MGFHDDYDGLLFRLSCFRHSATKATKAPSGGQLAVAQVAIAWVAAQGSDIVPLVGARRREPDRGALARCKIDAGASGCTRQRVPARRRRRHALQMAHLESEKRKRA
jgi:hypothetical protein